MTNKKIVESPTPESSPSLYYGDNDSVINLLFFIENFDPRLINTIKNKHKHAYSPVSFNDIKTVRNIKEKYRSMRPKMSWAGKFCDFFDYSQNGLRYIFFYLLIAIIESFITLIIIRTLYSFIKNEFLMIVLNIIMIIILAFCMFGSWIHIDDKITYFNNLPRNMKYNNIKFHKKDKKLLKDKIFLDTSRYDKQEKHLYVMKKINDVFNYIEDTDNSDSIDLYELKNLYNEYMRLLSFMLTNKDNISQELYDNYDQQLEELSQNIIKESNNIITLINVKNNYMKKNKEELDNLNQEILDNDAMNIFPMK